MSATSRAGDKCAAPENLGTDGFCYPAMELRGDLAATFIISDCQWISGLTCHIGYSGARPLPSEVFFTEYDRTGKQLGPHTRLIYPNLGSGERGIATFRIGVARPARIALEGLWNGPWKNPY
jgi:hypothetical protein